MFLANHKKSSQTQKYENYWKLTLEYSDIHGIKFSTALELIIYFIDNHQEKLNEGYSKELYTELQNNIEKIFPKANSASTRKSINQFVKLGFIEPYLKGYKKEAKSFLNAQTKEERELIFSEIYYKYSSFNSSVTKDLREYKQINFLLKTLMYHPDKTLKKDDIIGLMMVDISKNKRGYLTKEQIEQNKVKAEIIEFIDRKYNQVNYFMNYLVYIPGVSVTNDKSLISYTEDATIQLGNDIDVTRDPTMFRIMKEKVKQESIDLYGKVQCYLTKREQKGLVVSHIWRSSDALRELDVEAAYDPNNALLLEPTTDQYFDKHDLTIDSTGDPVFNRVVPNELRETLKKYKIDEKILTSNRQKYLIIHNFEFDEKNKI